MRMLLVFLGMLAIVGAVLGQVVELGGQFGISNGPLGRGLVPAMAMDSVGNVVVVWGLSSRDHIGARRFAADGSPLGDEFQVNTYTSSNHFHPAVAADDAGRFFVVWASDFEDGDLTGIQGRRFDASGSALGDPFQINTYTTDHQFGPAVSIDAAGNSVVVWISRDQVGCHDGIFGQRFDAGGDPSGNEFQINVYTPCSHGHRQSAPDVAMISGGGFVVAWHGLGEGGRNVWGRLYGSDGNPLGDAPCREPWRGVARS